MANPHQQLTVVVDSVSEPHQDGAFHHRRELLSLLEMIKQYGRQLFLMSQILAHVSNLQKAVKKPTKPSAAVTAKHAEALEEVVKALTDAEEPLLILGLKQSAKYLQQMTQAFSKATHLKNISEESVSFLNMTT